MAPNPKHPPGPLMDIANMRELGVGRNPMQVGRTNRRAFITLLGGAAVWPMVARAQQSDRVRRVAALMAYEEGDPLAHMRVLAFRNRLAELGWTEGRNIQIEFRFSGVDSGRMQHDATDLVELAPDVLLAAPAQAALTLQKVASNIPLVFANVPDPISIGLVENLAHPGGNTTGFTNFEVDISGKWLELLKEIAPSITRVAAIYSPQNPVSAQRLRLIETVAPRTGFRIITIPVTNTEDIQSSLKQFAAEPNGGVVVLPSVFMAANRETVIETTARLGLPAVYPFRYFPLSGGLLSYGIDGNEQFRGAASYVDRILRGEKPAVLPVQAPTKFEVVVNLNTAKGLGLTIPPTLLARADEVIE
jgi:putative ABC transport system substrate-binding protein